MWMGTGFCGLHLRDRCSFIISPCSGTGIIRANGHELESYHPGRVSAAEIGSSVREMMQSMFTHLHDLEAFGDLAFPRTTRNVIETLRVA